jgi:hypothetical protein
VELQAALVFFLWPRLCTRLHADRLPGETAVRGVGVLFAMWNLPYLVALWHPRRYRLALQLALAMQVLGVVGESLIYLTVPADYAVLRASLFRFIAFDAVGALLLAGAYWLLRKE